MTTDDAPAKCDVHVWRELTDKIVEEVGSGLAIFFGVEGNPSIYVMCSKCGERAVARPIEDLKVDALPALRDGFEVRQ